jgi:RNA polymerase sigma-70 factor (ECF subfamily)
MREVRDKETFVKLIETNKAIIYKISRSYCADVEDVDDLVQEIIYNLWKAFDKFNPDYKFSTWMYRIALNVAISYYKKGLRAKPNMSMTDSILELDDAPDAGNEDNLRLLLQFIGELRDIDRSIMLLYLEEKNHKEIAEITGITESNVSTKISRIKDKLKVSFQTLQNK